MFFLMKITVISEHTGFSNPMTKSFYSESTLQVVQCDASNICHGSLVMTPICGAELTLVRLLSNSFMCVNKTCTTDQRGEYGDVPD